MLCMYGGEVTALLLCAVSNHPTTRYRLIEAQSDRLIEVRPGPITPINKQIKCISQNFGSYTILLVAASGRADWWYVVVTPRRVF